MQPSTQPLVVILTHEHTDFGALASLLAAARLSAQRPRPPRQMNRNLEAFLADYAELLPFVRQDDLPKRRIEEFIAVDTQTIQPLRGQCSSHGPDNRPSPADARAARGLELLG